MSWTISTSFFLPTRGATDTATSANTLSFSMIRAMYDQDATGLSLSNYYKDEDIVTDITYNSVNPFDNKANLITEKAAESETQDEFRMSEFRGAFREHRVTVGDVAAPYNINPSTTEYRTYRYYVTGVVHQSASAWDSSGNGKSGMVVNVSNDNIDNIRVIVHVTPNGKIGGGPGQGGAGGGGNAAGGTGGTGGSGSSQNGVAGGNADCSGVSDGGDGVVGSVGKRGGHCIEIVNYSAGETFHIYKDVGGKLIPGGGGGGGAGSGGGGGAGATGGGGGHGAKGYNTAPLTLASSNSFWDILRDPDGDYRWRVEFQGNYIHEFSDDYNRYQPTSTSYNGKTYSRSGSALSTYSQTDDVLGWTKTATRYAVTISAYTTYFNGGPGAQGKSGVTGEPGHSGAPGGRGGYLNSGGTIIAASTGHTAQADKNDTSGSAGTSMYGQPSATAYNGTCNGGFGGQGGGSGGGGGGGGYAVGGAGGAAVATGSSAGNAGGGGRDGRPGLATVFYTAQSGFDNGCGVGGPSVGGAGCGVTSGGDGKSGGGGGAAGSFYVKASTDITVSSN